MQNVPVATFQRCCERSQLETLGLVVRQLNFAMQAGRTIDKRTVHNAKSLFMALDKDRNGSLSRDEIARGLKRLDVVMEAALFQMLLDTMDLNQDGLVDMDEFLRSLSVASYPRQSNKASSHRNPGSKGPSMEKTCSERSDASTAVPVGKVASDASTMTTDSASDASDGKVATDPTTTASAVSSLPNSFRDELKDRVACLEQELALVRSQSETQMRLADSLRQRLADVEVDQRNTSLREALEQHMASTQMISVTAQFVAPSPPSISRQILASPVSMSRQIPASPASMSRHIPASSPSMSRQSSLQQFPCLLQGPYPQHAGIAKTATWLSRSASEVKFPTEPSGA